MNKSTESDQVVDAFGEILRIVFHQFGIPGFLRGPALTRMKPTTHEKSVCTSGGFSPTQVNIRESGQVSVLVQPCATWTLSNTARQAARSSSTLADVRMSVLSTTPLVAAPGNASHRFPSPPSLVHSRVSYSAGSWEPRSSAAPSSPSIRCRRCPSLR